MNTLRLKTLWQQVQRHPVLLSLPAGLCAGLLVVSGKSNLIFVLTVVILAGLTVSALSPEKLLGVYFIYLMFEGGLKIWSNYNPLVHVGSDLCLVAVFLRLLYRQYTCPEEFPPVPARDARFATIVKFLALFWVWVAVQFLNPWGLGVLPSLAGLKLYVVPVLVFFGVGYLLKDEEARNLPFLFLLLGIFQSAVAILDWAIGPIGVSALHPRYLATIISYLKGSPYRPFGTTNLPGTPAVWIFHTSVAAMLVLHLRKSYRPRWRAFWTGALWVFLPLAVMTLVVCQIRLMLIRWAIVGIVGSFFAGRKQAATVALVVLVVALFYVLTPPAPAKEDMTSHKTVRERLVQALSRARTLERSRTWGNARGGWAWRELARRAGITLTGTGLSRVGAASAPWQDLINKDPYFGAGWQFTDNLYLAIFTELGIGGLIAYCLLMLALLTQLYCRHNYVGWIALVNCLAILISGYASEGILFQPDASFFWFYAAFGLRYQEPSGEKGGAA